MWLGAAAEIASINRITAQVLGSSYFHALPTSRNSCQANWRVMLNHVLCYLKMVIHQRRLAGMRWRPVTVFWVLTSHPEYERRPVFRTRFYGGKCLKWAFQVHTNTRSKRVKTWAKVQTSKVGRTWRHIRQLETWDQLAIQRRRGLSGIRYLLSSLKWGRNVSDLILNQQPQGSGSKVLFYIHFGPYLEAQSALYFC